MRVVFAIMGAVIGLSLASGSREVLGLAVGALAGFGIAELVSLRARFAELERELAALRKSPGGRSAAATPPAAQSGPAPEPAAAVQSQRSVQPPVEVQPPLEAQPPQWVQPAAPTPPAPLIRPASPATRFEEPAAAGAADAIQSAIGFIRDFFTGGNTLVRVGIIILFFGVAFLLRYVAEHSHVPIEFRLTGVALGGIVLLVLGWRLRARRLGYALALQGGAVGILYLTVFAGLRIYSVLPAGAAFALLVVIAAFSAALAILQSSQSFALLAVSGGFLAPILASTGQGNHLVLFSYYAVLNGGILAVAWFKAWRPLNLAGFLFTFVIGTVWGVLSYQPRLFASTEPFLILFFLFYVAMAILFASRQPPELRGYVDGTLVFGTPIVTFGLQAGMLHDRRFALAYSALAASAFYLSVATVLHRGRREFHRLLVESFLALGVLFLTLAVPLALDGRWSSATWAVEGAALVWIGCRQNRRLARWFGALLQIAGGVIFCFDIDAPHGTVPILNSTYLGGLMVSAASVFAALMLERHRDRLGAEEAGLIPVLFFWGVLWWLLSGLTEIQRRVPDRYEAAAGLLLMAMSAVTFSELCQRTPLKIARYPAIGLLPAMMAYAAIAVLELHHPFADGGWAAWPIAFAALYFVCRRHEGERGGELAHVLHTGSAWLLTALVSWEVAWAIDKGVAGGGSWPSIAWALVPAVALFVLPRFAQREGWPIGVHRGAYVGTVGVGIALYLVAWSLKTNLTLAGDPYPLPFVPLLNPLDLAEFFVILVLLRFWLHLRSARLRIYQHVNARAVFAALGGLAFIWLNAALLRSLHHWAGVPFQIEAMIRSTLVETSISIFWTVLALSVMLIATRAGARLAWLTGAALLGLVIVKLFIVDLSRVGTIGRIISFVSVGLLMLVIGYFSPLPPADGSPEPGSDRVGA